MDPDNLPSFCELRKNHKLKLKLGFYAAPSNLKIFSKAIKDELNKLKFTYCSDLNGLIMEFGRISSYELMPADFRHCINVALNVDVYIFGPPVGSILKAVVNQTSDNHISCLVHNLFNVSIVRPEDQPYDQWSGSKIKKEDIINVRVLSFDLTKKLPHITGDIVNKNDQCSKPENELDNYSSQCSSTDKSAKGIQKDSTSLLKQLSRESELSDEIHITTSPFKNKNKLKMSPIYKKTSINNREYIKNQLYSSTPISNSENSVNDITVIRNKPFEQFKNNLVKHNAEKLSIKQLKKYEKDDDSYAKHNIDVLNQERVKQDSEKEVTLNTSEENVSMPSFIHFSTIGTNFSPAKYNLESSSNENIILSVKDLDQKKNVNCEPEINKLDLTESKICMADSDDQSSSDDDNYTKLKQSILKQDDIKSYSDDKKFKLDNSVNVHSSSLSSKNRKSFQSNDKNDCKNQIINKIVQRQSTSTSDSESSSNENIILSVKDFDQKKNVNREPEIKKLDLTESKICMADSDDQSSSEDDNYTKLKQSILKQDDIKSYSDDKKFKLDNSVNVHSSSLSSKNRKSFQSNDKNDCKNQIINKIVQRQSTSTSDSESSSNENIILSVKDFDQKKNVNREPEIKKLDLTESKICMADSDDQSSSEDDNYTKLKQSILKQDDIKSYSDDKKFKLDNSVNVHSSSLSSKNRKTFQSNDKNDCKDQIINKVVQRQSTSTSDSESSSNENIILPVKDLDQKKNVNREPEINKLDLTESKICMPDSDDQSSSDDDSYTKLKQSILKQDDIKSYSDNKKFKLDNSVNVYSSSLSSKNRKTFQSNDKNDCKDQIINKVVQRQSTSTSDSESSSNENIILPVKDLDQKKNVNREPEINKLDLTESKICMPDSDDQSSSDDDSYTKLKQSILKQDDIKSYSDDKKFKLDNSVNVHSSSLSSKNRKTFQSNDTNDCKNQIINKVVQRQSTSTSSDSESSSNENIILPVKDLDQKKNVYKEIKRNKLNLTGSKINMTNIEYTSSSDDEIYKKIIDDESKQNITKPLSTNQNYHIIHSNDEYDSSTSCIYNTSSRASKLNIKEDLKNIVKTEDCHINSINNSISKKKKSKQSSLIANKQTNNKDELIKLILELSTQSTSISEKETLNDSVNIHASTLNTKNTKNYQTNDRKDYKKQIENKVVKKQSTISSSLSDSESSCENIKLPVKDLNQKKNVNYEPEIDKLNLTGSKINIQNTECENNSIADISKQVNKKLYTTNQIFNKVNYLNGVNDSLSYFVHDEYTPSSKLINSNTKKSCIKMAETDTVKIDKLPIEKTSKKNKKQKSSKCTLLKSPKDNKSLIDLMKITNNKDKLIKKILEEDYNSSISSVDTDNDLEFFKKNVEKQRLNKIKNAKVLEISSKNNNSNKQKKTIKKSDDIITKSQNATDKLSDFILDTHTPASKLINSYTKEHFVNVTEIDKNKIDKLSNEKTPKNNKKQGSENSTLLKSSKNNKSLRNLMKITNNKDKLVKTILDEDSSNSRTSSVSTDDDIEFIKKIVERQRLNKIKNAKLQEISIKNNTSNKQSKTVQKLDNKITKHQIATLGITDDLSSRKRKRSGELTKDLLLDSVLNSLQDSSSCQSPTKKKRIVDNSMMKTNDLTEHINYNKSSSEVKKKKKTKLNEDVITDDLVSQNVKTYREITKDLLLDKGANSLQDSSSCHSPTKKKRNVDNSMMKTNDLTEHINNDKSSSKVKKKKKTKLNEDVITDDLVSQNVKTYREITKDLLLDKVANSLQDSSSCHSPTKKKRNVDNSMMKTNDLTEHINYNKSSSEVKKKKKTKLNEDVITDDLVSQNMKTYREITNDLLLDKVANSLKDSSSCHFPTKKKRNVDNSMMKTNDLTEHINNDKSSSKVKKKKKTKLNEDVITDDLVSQNMKTYREITKDLLLDKVANSLKDSSSCHFPTKKKRNVDNSMMKTNDASTHINYDKSLSKVKKKKKTKLNEDIINLNKL